LKSARESGAFERAAESIRSLVVVRDEGSGQAPHDPITDGLLR